MGYNQEARTARGRELCLSDCRTRKVTGRAQESTRRVLPERSLAQQQEQPAPQSLPPRGLQEHHALITPSSAPPAEGSSQTTEVRTRGRVSHLAGATGATFHTVRRHIGEEGLVLKQCLLVTARYSYNYYYY